MANLKASQVFTGPTPIGAIMSGAMEYSLASISPDESFHFELGDVFTDENGVAILFETYLEVDEGESLLDVMEFEGGEEFVLLDFQQLIFKTVDGIHGTRPFFSVAGSSRPNLNNSNNASFTDLLSQSNRYQIRVRNDTDMLLVNYSMPTIIVNSNVTNRFLVKNGHTNRWDSSPALMVFLSDTGNHRYLILSSIANTYSFRPATGNTWHVTGVDTESSMLLNNVFNFFTAIVGTDNLQSEIDILKIQINTLYNNQLNMQSQRVSDHDILDAKIDTNRSYQQSDDQKHTTKENELALDISKAKNEHSDFVGSSVITKGLIGGWTHNVFFGVSHASNGTSVWRDLSVDGWNQYFDDYTGKGYIPDIYASNGTAVPHNTPSPYNLSDTYYRAEMPFRENKQVWTADEILFLVAKNKSYIERND